MTSQESMNTSEHPHTITFEGMNIHDVLSSQTTNIELLQKLLDQGERPCSSGQCFILAARTGSLAVVQKLLEIEPSGINTKDEDGKSLLSYFAKQPKDLLQLLQMGANPAVSDIENVLQCAIMNSKIKDSEVMIEVLNIVTNAGIQIETLNSVHILQLLKNLPRTFKHVLELGVNPNIPCTYSMLIGLIVSYFDNLNDLTIYKEIFSILTAAGVKLEDRHGRSFIEYFPSAEKACHLLKLAFSPFNGVGCNVIEVVFYSIRKDYVKSLEKFIESGYNVMDKDIHGCTFLCSAIRLFLHSNGNSDGLLELVQYMLNHPGIRDENFNLSCQHGYHPQEILVGSKGRLRGSKIADMILNSKLKDTRRVSNIEFVAYCDVIFYSTVKYIQRVDISLISLHLHTCHDSRSSDVLDDIDYLSEHGFSINDPGVSPLTVVVSRVIRIVRGGIDIIKFLLQRGVNAEQKILVLKDEVGSLLQDLNTSLKLPDALLLAVSLGDTLEVLELLAPHTAFSPLASLPFNSIIKWTTENKIRMFRDLLSLGRVPHGTQTYRAIRDTVRDMANVEESQDLLLPLELEIPLKIGGIKSQELTIFDLAHRSPLSLLELSRYAVRMCLADTAAASNTQSLPQLFQSLLPPGLTDQLIAAKIARVRNSEDKLLKNELELLQNPPSLLLVKCVSNIAD